jgi:hypothetical protein
MMGIEVASRTTAILEAERHDPVGASSGSHLVAIRTRHSRVRSTQRETRFTVLGYCKSGTVEILNSVASLAFVQVRSGGELVIVSILVTICANREFHFVDRIFARRQMALAAFDGHMFSS